MSERLTPEEDARDSLESYNEGMRAIGERVKAGAPVPAMLRSQAQLRAEATLPVSLLTEFNAFIKDYRAACEEAGIRPIANYSTFAYMIRHGWRKAGAAE